jgi:hypothetical protein
MKKAQTNYWLTPEYYSVTSVSDIGGQGQDVYSIFRVTTLVIIRCNEVCDSVAQ